MSVMDSKDTAALNHIHKVIDDAHELESVVALFKKYPKLEEIRQHQLAVDGEDCYGPWLGGSYYGRALDIVLKQWSNRELTKEQAYVEKLEHEVEALKEENDRLKDQVRAATDAVVRGVQTICNRAGRLGPEFKECMDYWHRSCLAKTDEFPK